MKLADDLSLIKNYIRTQSGGIEVPSESPLSVKIKNAKINRDLKVPPIESFDGSTDPSDFINLFDGRMDFFGHSEVDRCRFFSICLKGTALYWFNNLQPRSNDSWSILKSKFRTHFSSNKREGKITTSFISVYQRSNETLRAYLTRFRAHIAEITDHADSLAVNYLIADIDMTRYSQLLEEIFEKEPKMLQSRDRDFVYDASRYKDNKTWTSKPKDAHEPTKLNTDKATILEVLKTEPSYRPPRPMNPNRPPNNKYCEYHEGTGHETDRCFTNLIEEKICDGHLAHYVDNLRDHRSHHRDSDRVIDVISGGYSAGRFSNNSKKQYARDLCKVEIKRPRRNPTPVISFSDSDYTDDIIKDHCNI
ncbi:uncharacterized protein LOC141680478 [Apium graveolens]|uniref:uncharacterized protein LOC141680478 n=1 Tax=Apium graveolens TaxID=4045 RepID=UPI003D78C532